MTITGLSLKKVLIVGAKGFLGSHFLSRLSADTNIVATHHQPEPGMEVLDLLAPKVPQGHFDAAFICAGFGTPYRCQQQPEQCYQADVIGMTELCRQLHDQGVLPVVFSSSYAADPRDAYGWQKWEMEQRVADYSLIIRIGKLFGITPGDGTFFDEMVQKLLSKQKIVAAVDQFMNLVSVHEVVEGALECASTCQVSRMNFFSPSQASRYQMACFLVETMGYSKDEVIGTDLNQLGLVKRSEILSESDRLFSSWQQGALAIAKAYGTLQHLLGQI